MSSVIDEGRRDVRPRNVDVSSMSHPRRRHEGVLYCLGGQSVQFRVGIVVAAFGVRLALHFGGG